MINLIIYCYLTSDKLIFCFAYLHLFYQIDSPLKLLFFRPPNYEIFIIRFRFYFVLY